MSSSADRPEPVSGGLGLGDCTSLVVGIVVGASIYETPWLIFSNVPSAGAGLLAWLVGGLLAFCGALCYAELATTYPRSGGDYVYLGRAFGPAVGFLYGWAQLAAVLTANVGMMAYVFANYACRLCGWDDERQMPVALAAVLVLGAVNLIGLTAGRWTQNVLTLAKVLGIGAILVAGFAAAAATDPQAGPPPGTATESAATEEPVAATKPDAPTASDPAPASRSFDVGLAMVFVFFAYGGWSDAAFVAADVRDRTRNIPRALFLGVGACATIYLLMNAAFLACLGLEGLRNSRAPAADTLATLFGSHGERFMALVVTLSALGAVNGLLFTGARLFAALGDDHAGLALLSRRHSRSGSPTFAVVAETLVTAAMIVFVGRPEGTRIVNAALGTFGFDPIERLGRGGFDALLRCTGPVYWAFFLLTAVACVVLRIREPHVARPFRTPWFPLFPGAFLLMSLYMLYSSAKYAGPLVLWGLLPVVAGFPLYLLGRRLSGAGTAPEGAEEGK